MRTWILCSDRLFIIIASLQKWIACSLKSWRRVDVQPGTRTWFNNNALFFRMVKLWLRPIANLMWRLESSPNCWVGTELNTIPCMMHIAYEDNYITQKWTKKFIMKLQDRLKRVSISAMVAMLSNSWISCAVV